MDLDVRDLELLEALGLHGTLTAAGEHLHVSQPALSQRLGRLEERLGTPLFERRGRRLVPTRAGTRMSGAATAALAELRAATVDVGALRDGRGQPVRITSQCTTNYAWMAPIVGALRRTMPGTEVQIAAAADDDLIGALTEHRIDVALVTKLDREMDRVRLERLFDDELLLLARPGHPWAGREDVEPHEFAEVDLVLFESYARDRQPVVPLPLPVGASPRRLTTPPVSADLLVETVASGDAVTILPSWIARHYVEQGAVAPVGLTSGTQRRTWYCATRHGESSEGVARFVEELFAELGDAGPVLSAGAAA